MTRSVRLDQPDPSPHTTASTQSCGLLLRFGLEPAGLLMMTTLSAGCKYYNLVRRLQSPFRCDATRRESKSTPSLLRPETDDGTAAKRQSWVCLNCRRWMLLPPVLSLARMTFAGPTIRGWDWVLRASNSDVPNFWPFRWSDSRSPLAMCWPWILREFLKFIFDSPNWQHKQTVNKEYGTDVH